jgi:hypothetical protein
MNVAIFWDIAPYVNRSFGITYEGHLQGRKSAYSSVTRWFLVRQIFSVSPKRLFTYGLHGAVLTEDGIVIITAVRISNPTFCVWSPV